VAARSFPAAFDGVERKPFAQQREPITPRIRQLADTLAVEVLNDRFLSSERLEFMLQELLLSIVETYLAGRRASSPLWRGSRFEDTRIRRAIALLRAHPNKDLNIDQLANQVGLSRSRFYDLFQICTGFSPRAYLDMLCIEAAIARLSSGAARSPSSRPSSASPRRAISPGSSTTRWASRPPSTAARPRAPKHPPSRKSKPGAASPGVLPATG
jgi:AraC-like DNA-binding protein